ncbi:MAG: ribonuclease III domain-containing protein [Limisphaerales bacterium]
MSKPKTGDIFTIADPNLRLDQLEEVQRDVAMLLENGVNPPAPAEVLAPATEQIPVAQSETVPRKLSFVSGFTEFQNRLGYQFRDEHLLVLALTHPSIAHESGVASEHNQRLEFLGDAVLQLVLTQKLYEQFSAFDEGALTKARAKLVNRNSLAGHAPHVRTWRASDFKSRRRRERWSRTRLHSG